MERNKNKKVKVFDLIKTYFKWLFLAELANSNDKKQALAVMLSFRKILRKIYEDDEKYLEALKRNFKYFYAEPMSASLIHGAVISIEEEKANNENLSEDIILGIKSVFMDPIDEIGKILNFSVMKIIFTSLAIVLALKGYVISSIFLAIFSILMLSEGFYLLNFGYKLGKNSIRTILESDLISKLLHSCSIFIFFLAGVFSASFINIDTNLEIQKILDEIIKGFLPFILVLLIYYFIKFKKTKISTIFYSLVILSIIGSLIGVF